MMTRGNFLRICTAWAVGPWFVGRAVEGTATSRDVLTVTPEPRVLAAPRYGWMDAARWHSAGHYIAGRRVYLDGHDVTNDCTQFHDEEGWVELLVRDANGRAQWTRAEGVRRETRYGRVTVR
jgi:hypothetical protein